MSQSTNVRYTHGVTVCGERFWRKADLARALSTEDRAVSTRQVDAWHSRRERNGFPAPTATYVRGRAGGMRGSLWDRDGMEAVRAWFVSYVPSKGGRPYGSGRRP